MSAARSEIVLMATKMKGTIPSKKTNWARVKVKVRVRERARVRIRG